MPKARGGLGIRDLATVNKSLLYNTAWNIATNQDHLLTAVLKAKYFSNASFWTAPIHIPKSAFSSSILATKPGFNENCSYQICNGNTNIWSQPWCPIWQHMHDLLNYPNQIQPLPNIVFDFWIPVTRQ